MATGGVLFPHLLLDGSRVHVWHLSDGELGGDLGGDHSLGARGGEGPLDAVDGDGGVAPHVGQQVHLRDRRRRRSRRRINQSRV